MTTDISKNPDRTALVTGGSRGLGRALTLRLLSTGWNVITDGRDAAALNRLRAEAPDETRLRTVVGDVVDPVHRTALLDEVPGLGGLDLLVNNASELGPSPQPALADYPIETLIRVFAVNLVAPLALIQLTLSHLVEKGGRIVNLSSDAAVEAYEGWGGYGSSKAALDQLSNVLGAEHPTLRIYALDPGDMRTDMHALAFPGADISDRPEPESVLPALTALITGDLPSGRYRASTLLPAVVA